MEEVRLLAIGDLHLRKSKPAMRIDDFISEQDRKLDFILELAKTEKCQALIMPGDVFDRPDSPHGLVEWAIRKFSRQPYQFLFVFGQHDLRYHTSDKQNTPLGVLCAALENKAHILSPKIPYRLATGLQTPVFYGCSWGEPLPSEWEDDATRILVMHRPVTMEKLPWDHPDLIMAQDLIDTCPAHLFITGDNHVSFKLENKRAKLINLGSVMRTSIAQIEHKPQVALISIWGKQIKMELIPIPIANDVFDLERVAEKEENEEKLTAFIDGLQHDFNPELSFVDNLRAAAENCPVGVRKIISEVLQ